MNKLIVAVALALTCASAAHAQAKVEIDDQPPRIRPGMAIAAAIRTMDGHGWTARTRCLNAYPNVCETEFRNVCGVTYKATSADSKVTAFKYVGTGAPAVDDPILMIPGHSCPKTRSR
jgi:hypothetical protein